MDITIDLTALQEASKNPFTLAWYVLSHGGWLVVAILLLLGGSINAYYAWLSDRQRKFLAKVQYVMLALDIPKGNEQTPKAVEAIFSHLHGIAGKGNLLDRYWRGKVQHRMSFEIIGIEGQTQFLVRTPADYRDVVEAAVFAQYPDAEITEVLDYTDYVPQDFVAAGFDLWGAELGLTKNSVYPIRTYPFFEHSLSQQFLDPLGSLLELLGRLGPTEQVWLQLVITPAGPEWKADAAKEVKKILGIKIEEAKGLLSGIPERLGGLVYGATYGTVTTALASLYKLPEAEGAKKPEKEAPPKKFSDLTPTEKGIIEGIQMKVSKLAWEVKFRFIYLAQKEFFKPTRGITGVNGALKQYAAADLNGFAPEKYSVTKVDYWFTKRRIAARKHRILYNYRRREVFKKFQLKNLWTRRAAKPIILNTEELASLFHFPVMTVKAPQVQKTEAKRGEPPMGLPVDTFPESDEGFASSGLPDSSPGQKGEPPSNLPS